MSNAFKFGKAEPGFKNYAKQNIQKLCLTKYTCMYLELKNESIKKLCNRLENVCYSTRIV